MKVMKLTLLMLIVGLLASPLMAATHVMKKGDTLWDLAAKHYGDPSLYPLLLQVNRIDNPRTIANGKVIIIPAKSEMSKIALEKNVSRRENMIEKIAGSSDTANTNANPLPSKPINSGTTVNTTPSSNNTLNEGVKRYSGRIRDGANSFKNILKGPKVDGDKLINIKLN